MSKGRSDENDVVMLQIPRRISPRARAKLHELVDELFSTQEGDGGSAELVGADALAVRFVQTLEEREPRLLKYIRVVASAGENGLTLTKIGEGTGAEGRELGGVASAVTRIWHRISGSKGAIVEKEYDRHYIRRDMLKALQRVLDKQ